MAQRIRHQYKGFTLIESLFGLALFVMFSGAVWYLRHDFLQTSNLVQGNLIGQQEINRTFKTFSMEARIASTSSLGAYPLVETTATSFTFYSDAENDGLKERIRYFLQNGVLKRGYLKPTGNPLTYNTANESVATVVRDVVNGSTPVFTYFDSTYDGTTEPLTQPVNMVNVRLVRMVLMINKNGNSAPSPSTFTTQISLRNLKDNT